MAGGDRRVAARPRRRYAGVLVLWGGAGRGGGGRPEGERGLAPVPRRRRVRQVVVGGRVGVLVVDSGLEVVVRWGVVPGLAVVADDPRLGALAVAGGDALGGDVERAGGAAVAGHAGRRRARRGGGGGGRRRRRAGHPAVADRRGGALRGGRGALLVDAAVHHRPPRHPGGSPRSGGWGGSGGVHMVVQGGRGARHGVRDGEDDGRAMGSQHRRGQRSRPGDAAKRRRLWKRRAPDQQLEPFPSLSHHHRHQVRINRCTMYTKTELYEP